MVTRRTVERDLAALRFAGVPIEGEVGRTAGYSLAPSKGSVVFSLGPEEMVAVLLAVRAASGLPFGAPATTATQRLLDALPRRRASESTNSARASCPPRLRSVRGECWTRRWVASRT